MSTERTSPFSGALEPIKVGRCAGKLASQIEAQEISLEDAITFVHWHWSLCPADAKLVVDRLKTLYAEVQA